MQLKKAIFIDESSKAKEVIKNKSWTDINFFASNEFYDQVSNFEISILCAEGFNISEVIINFVNTTQSSFLIILTDDKKLLDDKLINSFHNVYIVSIASIDNDFKYLIQDIEMNSFVETQYIRFLYNVLKIESLDLKSKKEIFDLSEGFRDSILLKNKRLL